MSENRTTREWWRLLVCRWRGHAWAKAGIETDAMYRCWQIIRCKRCGVDQEDARRVTNSKSEITLHHGDL